MMSAYFTGVIYMIYNWISKVPKPQDRDPLRLGRPVQQACGLGAGVWLGKIRERSIKPVEPEIACATEHVER